MSASPERKSRLSLWSSAVTVTVTHGLLANVNSCSRSLCYRPSVCRLSVVCNVRAPYSGDWNFLQCFYAIWYLCHLWPFDKNFTEIVSGKPYRLGGLNRRGVAEYSDFWPFQGYISETVQIGGKLLLTTNRRLYLGNGANRR